MNYDDHDNRKIFTEWEEQPDLDRAQWYRTVREALIDAGIETDILAEMGPHEALGLALALDGCPLHTLPRHVRDWVLQLKVWCHHVRHEGHPLVLKLLGEPPW